MRKNKIFERFRYIGIAFLVLSVFGLSSAAAETGVNIILVSDNFADCAVAETLAEENGAIIVKTVWGEFEQSVLETIVSAEPAEVIIIGGPMAVVQDYETKLQEAGINVTRLWGRTRQQTSLAVFNQFRMRYNWTPAVGDGTQPYRLAGRFPVWYFDNDTEIDSFIRQHRAMVLNYSRTRGFAGRYGSPVASVTLEELENFRVQLRSRIYNQYANQSWIHQRMRGVGMRAGMGIGK